MSDPQLRARGGGMLFLIAGAIGFVALLLPGGAGTSTATAVATAGAALVIGVVLWRVGSRFSPVWFQAIAILATSLTSVSAYYGGAEGWLNGFYYFWIGLFAAYFFTSRQIVLQLVVIAAEYGVVLGWVGWQHPALIWFLTISTLAVTTALVAFLRGRLERALALEHEQVERLQELDRLKDDFIATVSHELRTPVTAVYGAAETLRLRRLDPPLREELLRVIYAEAERLAQLTNDMLQTTAIDRHAVQLELRAVDPVLVATEAADAARMRAGRPIGVVAAAGLGSVQADPLRLLQVLSNLLDNAIKYSKHDTPVEIRLSDADPGVRIAVRDQGHGIPARERERVFEKFHRLDPQMTGGVGGSGLGLYIVSGLVGAMNGRVWIEPSSVDAPGTTVVIDLPKGDAASDAASAVS